MKEISIVNGVSSCGCKGTFSDGKGEYADVMIVQLCCNHAGDQRVEDRKFLSDRGIPLFVSYGIADRPVLTVENYIKWYDMYVVYPDGHVEALQTPAREKTIFECEHKILDELKESAFGDHVFNPYFFTLLAKVFEFDVDPIAFEVVIGRWLSEHSEKYRDSRFVGDT